MTTSKQQILHALTPGNPATVGALIGFHRAHFGAARMENENDDDGGQFGENGDPAGESGQPETGGGTDEPLGEPGKKALQAERDAHAREKKRADDLAAKLQEHEDAKLTEQQRTEKALDDERGKTASLTSTVARYEAAEKAGIPLSWAKRLVGATAEELEADAKTVADQLKTSTGPRPDPSQGGGGGSGQAGSVQDAMDEYRNRKKQSSGS